MMKKIMLMVAANQLARFLLVGTLNTVFGYSVFAILVFCGVHYAIAVLFATIIGILFNFRTLGVIVFRNKDKSLILKFTAVYFFIYIINITALKILTGFAINIYISSAMLVLPLALLSFLLNKKFVFQTK